MGEVGEAVILASGVSRRLRAVTGGIPKCFYVVGGVPLMQYPALAVARGAGVRRFDIVLPPSCGGLCSETVESVLRGFEVCVAYNDRVEWGNAYSLMVAEACVRGERFIVSVCDSLYTPSAVESLVKAAREFPDADVIVGGSRCFRYVDIDEATKIRLGRDGEVLAIGKGVRDFDLVDVGLFVMRSTIFTLKKALAWGVRELSIFDLLMRALRAGLKVVAADLGDEPWTEVDTVDDLKLLLKGSRSEVLKLVAGALGIEGR